MQLFSSKRGDEIGLNGRTTFGLLEISPAFRGTVGGSKDRPTWQAADRNIRRNTEPAKWCRIDHRTRSETARVPALNDLVCVIR